MAEAVGSLVWKVGVDDTGVRQKLASIDAAFKNAAQRVDGVSRAMVDVGKKATMFLTLPIVGAGVASVKAFTDLGEAVNAVNVTFGKGSEALIKYAETAATSVGLSKRAFLQAAVPIGASLQNVGYSAEEASEQTIMITKRAADMASVFNVDVSEALLAVQSGLRGESEPLKRFGVGLDETSVKAFAVANGIAKEGEEMTVTQKATARLGLFMKQTNKVNDDFKNTSDSLANRQRILRARLEDTAATLGAQLAPMATKILEKVSGLIDKFQSLDPATQKLIITIGAVVAIGGPLLIFIGKLILAIKGIAAAFTFVAAHPAILVVTAVILAVGGLAFLIIKNWDTLKKWFGAFWNWLKNLVGSGLNWLRDKWNWYLNFVKSVWNGIKSTALSVFNAVKNFVSSRVNDIVSKFRSIKGFINTALSNVAEAIKAPFRSAFNWIGEQTEKVKGFVNRLNPFHRESPSLVDNVRRGLAEVTRQYRGTFNELGRMSLNTKANMNLAPAGAMTGAGGNTYNISNMNVNNKADEDRVQAILGRKQELSDLGFNV